MPYDDTGKDVFAYTHVGPIANEKGVSRNHIIIVMKNGLNNIIEEHHQPAPEGSAHVQHYQAIIRALEMLIDRGHQNVAVMTTSDLVGNQIMGNLNVSDPLLKVLHHQVSTLRDKFEWSNIGPMDSWKFPDTQTFLLDKMTEQDNAVIDP